MTQKVFVLNYGSTDHRSAGDWAYSTREAALAAFRRWQKRYPEIVQLRINECSRECDNAPWHVRTIRNLQDSAT